MSSRERLDTRGTKQFVRHERRREATRRAVQPAGHELKLGQNTKRSERDVVRDEYSTGSNGSTNWIVTYVSFISCCVCEISRSTRGSASSKHEEVEDRTETNRGSVRPSYLSYAVSWHTSSRRRSNELTSRNHDDLRATRRLRIVNNPYIMVMEQTRRMLGIFRHDER